jgi:hypothetical protein
MKLNVASQSIIIRIVLYSMLKYKIIVMNIYLIISSRSIRIWTTKITSINRFFFLIIFKKSFAISCIMISHFTISAFDLIAIQRSFEWLIKIEIFSISISISFSKFFSITTFASIIALNRFLWCVNDVETIAFIKLKTMRFEFINHFFSWSFWYASKRTRFFRSNAQSLSIRFWRRSRWFDEWSSFSSKNEMLSSSWNTFDNRWVLRIAASLSYWNKQSNLSLIARLIVEFFLIWHLFRAIANVSSWDVFVKN